MKTFVYNNEIGFYLKCIKFNKKYKIEITHKVDEIRENIMSRSYYHGSTKNALEYANNEINKYIDSIPEYNLYDYSIIINGRNEKEVIEISGYDSDISKNLYDMIILKIINNSKCIDLNSLIESVVDKWRM